MEMERVSLHLPHRSSILSVLPILSLQFVRRNYLTFENMRFSRANAKRRRAERALTAQ